MQRAWVEEHFCAGQQRRKQPHRQAKGVEQRQRRHKTVIRGKVGNAFDLFNVRQNALVAVDDAFRVALRSRREENDRVIFRLLFDLRQTRHQQVSKNPQLVAGGHVRFQILQEDPAHLGELLGKMPELAFVQELTRGKDGINLGSGDGAGQPFHARRVVHHCRDAPPGNRTKNHRRADACVRQHQANLFALHAVFLKNAAHKEGLSQQLAIGIRGKVDVFDAVFLRAIAVLSGKQRFVQRFARTHGHARFHHNLMQHFPGDFTAIAGTRGVRHR